MFAQAIREAEYWAKEFTTPATLLLAKHRQLLDKDSSSSDGDGPGPSRTAKRRSTRKKKPSAKKYRGEDLSVKENGVFTKNRKGFEICVRFNKGACGNGKPQSKCPASRSHQCNLCLGPHTGQECKGKQN